MLQSLLEVRGNHLQLSSSLQSHCCTWRRGKLKVITTHFKKRLKCVVITFSFPLRCSHIVVHGGELSSTVSVLLILSCSQFTGALTVLKCGTGFVEEHGQIIGSSVVP